MTAAVVNITVEQGATFKWSGRFGTLLVDAVTGLPILDANGNQQIDVGRDFTGCTARCEIRQKYVSTTFYTAVTDVANLNGGVITLDNLGNVHLTIDDEQTDFLVKSPCVWDLKVYLPSGEEDRLVQGVVTVSPAVTRDI